MFDNISSRVGREVEYFLAAPFPSSSTRNTDPREVKEKIFYLFALAAKKC